MTTTRDCAYFFCGLSAGVAAALLIAPRSGPETRNEIRQTLEKGKQILRDGKANAVETLDREKEGLKAAIDAGKNAYRETTGRSTAGSEIAAVVG